jgi:hypothetical protein
LDTPTNLFIFINCAISWICKNNLKLKNIHKNKKPINHTYFRHSNGSNEDGDDAVDDARSLSRSASENNVNQQNGAQNGGLNINNENNNNGYRQKIN